MRINFSRIFSSWRFTSCNSRLSDSTSCECLASASIAVTLLSMTKGLVGPSDTLEFADAGCVESSE